MPVYIIQWFESCKIANASEKLWRILEAGRGLILLDGLDEVREEDNQRVIRNIEDFYRSYGDNQFAVTCRIAARECTFTQFTEVEVADFDESQIETFVNKEYFFKQRTIERYIGEYICNLPNAPQEQIDLDIDSQAVLKSIEGQHGLLVERARGIYSFSHLTFQEYFTARKIATISNPEHDLYTWNQWWENNRAAWSEELRQAMIKHRNIGHQWDFNQEQIKLLDRYLTANQLLVDCLHSECYVSREVREEIENTLLLPFSDSNHKSLWFY